MRDEPGDFVNNTARERASRTAARLTFFNKLLLDLIDDGKLKIHAAIYDLQTGVITYLD